MDHEIRLANSLRANGLVLSEEQLKLLTTYQELLLDWNKKINLISRNLAEPDVVFSHFFHSLSPLFFISPLSSMRVLDVGSGGGLPGIPLAIACPALRIVLVDSIAKKAKAVEAMVATLGLPNVQVLNARVEELVPRRMMRGRVDLLLARAVAPLTDLVLWSKDLVGIGAEPLTWKQSGGAHTVHLPALFAWKGGDLDDEIAMMRTKTGRTAEVFPLGFEDKKLVVVELSPAGGRR